MSRRPQSAPSAMTLHLVTADRPLTHHRDEGTPIVLMQSPDLIAWQASMRAEGLAQRTVADRPTVIARAAAAMGCDVLAMTEDSIVEWIASCATPGTRATYFGALRAWHAWLLRTDRRTDDPTARLRTPRVPRRLPRPVATAHLEALLASRMHKRTRVMIHLAAFQALRVHEVAKVRGEDVDVMGGTLRVIGKGGVEAHLPLHPTVRADARRMPRQGWWFPALEGDGPIRRDSVSSIISEAMGRVGVPGTAHQLRHWYATTLLEEGVDVRVVQELMRHASLATTAIYTRVSDRQRVDAVARLPRLDLGAIAA